MCFLFLTGAPVYLLDLFCNATNPNVREKTAELLAKMLSDKLVGPKCRIILSKFLPPIFMDAMRDSPEASVHMFEGKYSSVTCKIFTKLLENLFSSWRLFRDLLCRDFLP